MPRCCVRFSRSCRQTDTANIFAIIASLLHFILFTPFHPIASYSARNRNPCPTQNQDVFPISLEKIIKLIRFFFKFCSHKFSTGETIKYFSFIDRYNIDTVITSIASKLTHSTGCTGFFFSGFCEVSPGFSSSVAGVIGLHLRCTNQSFSVVILFCSSRNTESTPRDRPQRPVMLQGAMGWGVGGLGSS